MYHCTLAARVRSPAVIPFANLAANLAARDVAPMAASMQWRRLTLAARVDNPKALNLASRLSILASRLSILSSTIDIRRVRSIIAVSVRMGGETGASDGNVNGRIGTTALVTKEETIVVTRATIAIGKEDGTRCA